MKTDPKKMVYNAEKALLAAMDKRLADTRESMVGELCRELESLRAAVAQMPKVTPLLTAAGEQAPEYCQAGTFALPKHEENSWGRGMQYSKRPPPVIDQVRFSFTESGSYGNFQGHNEIQTAPYQGIAASEVVRAMSGKGLEDGRRYRYVFMAWAEPDEKPVGD